MPKLIPSPQFVKSHLKLVRRNPKLLNQIFDTLHNFTENPQHRSLRLHKLNNSQCWSLSVNRSIRITYEYVEDYILLVDIGTHDEVYR